MKQESVSFDSVKLLIAIVPISSLSSFFLIIRSKDAEVVTTPTTEQRSTTSMTTTSTTTTSSTTSQESITTTEEKAFITRRKRMLKYKIDELLKWGISLLWIGTWRWTWQVFDKNRIGKQ